MGAVTLPTSGLVYVDTAIFIYSVELHPVYAPLLRPFWQDVRAGRVQAVTSALTLMEVLVKPLREKNHALAREFKEALQGPDVRLLGLTRTVLRRAAALRADIPRLRTPDALHAATALQARCPVLLTNDAHLTGVPGLTVVLLEE